MIRLYWKAYGITGRIPRVQQTVAWRGTKLVPKLILLKFKSEIIRTLYTTCLKLSNDLNDHFHQNLFSDTQQWLICGSGVYKLLSSLKNFDEDEKRLGRFKLASTDASDTDILLCGDNRTVCGKIICEF